MKHKGAVMEYSQERSDDLMRAYDEYLESCDYIRMPEVYATIANMPSKRFWVSEMRAASVISSMEKGEDDLTGMRPLKREMFMEIYNRVKDMIRKQPDLPLNEACAQVISQPAPKFYMTPGSAKMAVCKARKEWIRRKMEKLHLL